jgi:hypothetical protein
LTPDAEVLAPVQNPQVVSYLSAPVQVDNSEHIFRNHSTVPPTCLVKPEAHHNVSRSTLEAEVLVLRENPGFASNIRAGLRREASSIANHAITNNTPHLTLENLQQLDNSPLHGLDIWLSQGKNDDATRFYQG